MQPQRTRRTPLSPDRITIADTNPAPTQTPSDEPPAASVASPLPPDPAPERQSISANTDPTPGSDQIFLSLRRADQLFLGSLLLVLLLLLIACRWKLSGGGRAEIEIVSQQPREYFYTIDINRASWVEWAQLDGIGEKLARRIIEDRNEHGPFRSVDEIRRVRGLGPKVIDKLRPFLKCLVEERKPSEANSADHSREGH